VGSAKAIRGVVIQQADIANQTVPVLRKRSVDCAEAKSQLAAHLSQRHSLLSHKPVPTALVKQSKVLPARC
jgi:hypothetical protein